MTQKWVIWVFCVDNLQLRVLWTNQTGTENKLRFQNTTFIITNLNNVDLNTAILSHDDVNKRNLKSIDG